jgi:NAD-dependent SIR2 family protein deacetylase
MAVAGSVSGVDRPIFVQKKGTGKKDSARNKADKRASPKYNFLHVLMCRSVSFAIFSVRESVSVLDPEPKLKPDSACRTKQESIAELCRFFVRHERIAVLSGAGCSTQSGIPDYRDDAGHWKHRRPVQLAEFVSSAETRRRYWAQSFAGWNRVAAAKPNSAHLALARLERARRIECLVTQNVDNLHRAAGSRNVIDLHGVLHRIRCLGCGVAAPRAEFQARLAGLNPEWQASVREIAPDGDARLSTGDFRSFSVPCCDRCGGTLKPDVVFFGEPVPAGRVAVASESVGRADALLIVGSSLMVFSGFRFARMAQTLGKPIAILNRGTTRADDFAACKLTDDCGAVLSGVADCFTKDLKENARGLDRRL